MLPEAAASGKKYSYIYEKNHIYYFETWFSFLPFSRLRKYKYGTLILYKVYKLCYLN